MGRGGGLGTSGGLRLTMGTGVSRGKKRGRNLSQYSDGNEFP